MKLAYTPAALDAANTWFPHYWREQIRNSPPDRFYDYPLDPGLEVLSFELHLVEPGTSSSEGVDTAFVRFRVNGIEGYASARYFVTEGGPNGFDFAVRGILREVLQVYADLLESYQLAAGWSPTPQGILSVAESEAASV